MARSRWPTMLTVSVLLAVLGCSSVPQPPAPLEDLSALQTVALFHDYLRARELGRAHEMLFEPVRQKDYAAAARGASELARGWSDFSAVDAREDGDVAVAVIHEHLSQGRSATNYYPVCLVRQGGRWRILQGGYREREADLPAGAHDRFGSLEAWFGERKAALLREANDQ